MLFKKFLEKKNTTTLRQHLMLGTGSGFVIKIVSTGLTFLTSVVLARVLGADGLGSYAFAIAVIQLLVLPTTLGLQQLIVREVAAKSISLAWGEIRGLLKRADQATLGTAFLMMFIVFAGTYTWSLWSGKEQHSSLYVLWLGLLLIPMRVVTRIKTAMLRGFRFVILSQIPMLVVRPTLFLLLILIFYRYLPSSLEPQEAMLSQVMATGLAMILILVMSTYCIPQEIHLTRAVYKTKTWIKSAWPFLLAGSLHIVNNQTDVIMLGLLADPKDVGLYRVAQRGSELIIFSLTAVNMAIAPTVSQLYVQGDFERLQRIFSKSVRWIMVFSLPMALVLIFGGQYILRYVFGAEFVSGRNALAVLACAQLVNAGMGSVGLILNMTGHEKDTARVLLMTAVLNILLNALLIPLYGILGAALATGFSLVLWNVVLHILVYRRTCLKAHFFL